jgi:hypothetical protein
MARWNGFSLHGRLGCLSGIAVALACVLITTPAAAQDSGSPDAQVARAEAQAPAAPGAQVPSAPGSEAPSAAVSPGPASSGFWGLNGSFGAGGAGGDFGNLFTAPVSWDYNFFRQQGAWRFGIGASFGSFKMKDPYEDELEWGYQQLYLFGTRMLRTQGAVRPYVQLRAGLTRLRPRSPLFDMNPLPPDFESGQARIEKTDGFGIGVIPGVEVKLAPAAFLDASFSFTYFKVSEYDLAPVQQPPRSAGTAWEGRIGLTWLPSGDGRGSDDGPRDAWGVKQSYGWAAGEVLAINNVSGIAAQYIRNVDWSETSPRSWWSNIDYGFAYDSDEFKTNQWTHPFNGAAYYNSSRANGIGFWPSTGFALAGALEWESSGETQRMSYNDMFATTLGGIALGEAQYRLSSEILDNRATGVGRFFREFGAFVVDPVRGFNRLVSGDAKRVADNPVDPQDRRPEGSTTFVATGMRSIGEGSSISHNTKSYATVLLNHSYGDVFDNPRRKPFDYIDFVGELNFGEKVALGNVQIRGNLASWPLGGKPADHVIAIVQHFDYMNNTAYEFGGQSLGAALSSRFRLTNRLGLATRLDADGILLAGINSEYANAADVPNQERLREYDYGPGLGASVSAHLLWSGRPLLTALYRFAWVSVKNGSVYNKGTVGSDADHYIQGGGLRLVVPVKGNLGIGADAFLFLRNSDFSVTDSVTGATYAEHVKQRNPQLRVYLSMSTAH